MSQRQLPLEPTVGGEWIGAVISLPTYIRDDGPPYRPSVVVWLDTASGRIVGTEMLAPDAALPRAAELFRRASAAPMHGDPRRPARLRVGTPELARALEGQIGDVQIIVAPTPEADRLAAALSEARPDDDDDQTYIGPDMTAADVAAFFRAAARLYRAAPWDHVPTDGFISVACPSLGIEAGALCVVGQGGDSYGFALFRTIADATAYLDACEQHLAGGPLAMPPHMMLSYDERATLGAGLGKEIRHHRWEVAGKAAYPCAVAIDGDLVSRGLTRDELAGVTAIAQALARFAGDGQLADAWEDDAPVTLEHTEDAIGVVLGAPLRLLDEEPDAIERFSTDPSATSEHLTWIDLLAQYATDYLGAPLEAVSPAELHTLLFEIVPRKVSCEPEDAPAIIAATSAFLAFAARTIGAHANEALASLPTDAAQQLARRLADPRLFGPAKSLVMNAKRAGYELSDAGLAAYLKTAQGEQRPSSAARNPAAKAKRVKRKAERKARKSSRRR